MELVDVKVDEAKTFQPFTISLKIWSESEAKLLWHVFNRCKLREAIIGKDFNSGYGQSYGMCDEEFANMSEIRYELEKHIFTRI